MKLAMRLPEKNPGGGAAGADPRDSAQSEVIDLASRTAYPAVANRQGKSDTLVLLAGVGFVALLGAATWWGLNASRTVDVAPQPEADVAAAPAPAPAPAEASPLDGLPSANAGAAGPRPDPAPAATLDEQQLVGSAANPYNSPALVFDGSWAANVADAATAAEAAAATTPQGSVIPGGGAAGEFAARIGGVGGGPALARQDINPATTIATGTMIPAVLETAINTDVPGYVRAVVSQDVKSFDGSRVLVPRSSRLVGQYQSGLQAGQTRAYVIWTRLIRPDGVSVQLASPATSFDGTAGLEGEVDGHFFSRFGSAMLLSVIGGLTTIAGGGAQVILGGGQNAAATAVQQDGQRPPTVRVRMGAPIRVYTARDLDFSLAPQVD
jgi:type IV secretion system protein VirB10